MSLTRTLDDENHLLRVNDISNLAELLCLPDAVPPSVENDTLTASLTSPNFLTCNVTWLPSVVVNDVSTNPISTAVHIEL